MHRNKLNIASVSDPILPLLDLSEVPELPHPARAPQAESIVARAVVSAPEPAPKLEFALDSAVVMIAALLASAGLFAWAPGGLSRDLPAPLASIGFALFELTFSRAAPVCAAGLIVFGCAVALSLAGARGGLRRFREAHAPRRLVVGPPHEVTRYVGGDRPLEGAASLAALAPTALGNGKDTDPVTLPALVLSRPTDEVVLLRGWKSRERCEQTFRDCATVGVDVAVELEIEPSLAPEGARLERRGDRSFARYTFVPRSGFGRGLKWALEYTAALLLTLIGLPLMAAVALAIKLSSPGPVIFRQLRTGLNGRRIPCFKFRTMVDGAHAAQRELSAVNEIKGSQLLFKMDNDPRVTRVGRFLRCTSLDELPQLFNVLRGELTLIGPRLLSIPLERYQPAHRRRLSVRPGIACAWQAWHRGETDFEAWMRSDLDYLDRWSLFRDLKILLRTAWVVLRREGAR